MYVYMLIQFNTCISTGNSVYAERDTMELNYHAGTACHKIAKVVTTEHVGVKVYDNDIADAMTTMFLISICVAE